MRIRIAYFAAEERDLVRAERETPCESFFEHVLVQPCSVGDAALEEVAEEIANLMVFHAFPARILGILAQRLHQFIQLQRGDVRRCHCPPLAACTERSLLLLAATGFLGARHGGSDYSCFLLSLSKKGVWEPMLHG